MNDTITILSSGEPLRPPAGFQEEEAVSLIEIEGRSYQCHSYKRPLELLERVIKTVILVACITLTLFTALIFERFRSLGRECLTGYELRQIAAPATSVAQIPDDVLKCIMSRCTIRDLGNLAPVSRHFSEIQNNSAVWQGLADEQGIEVPDDCLEVKDLVRDTVVLNLGVVDLRQKRILWRGEEPAYAAPFEQRELFFRRAISYFEKEHYVSYYYGYGASGYHYKDSDGVVKFVRSCSRMDFEANPDDEALIERIVAEMTQVPLIGSV